MRKTATLLLISLMILGLTACTLIRGALPTDGEGEFTSSDMSVVWTEESPYIITTVEELYTFVSDYNDYKLPLDIYVRLDADITVNDIADVYMTMDFDSFSSYRMWTPVQYFQGVFDGNGHTISGLVCCMETLESGTINWPSAFIGFLYRGAEIKNLTIKESYFTSHTGNSVAGICGINSGTIENCVNYARIGITTSSGGGIVADNRGIIKNCVNYSGLCNVDDGCTKGLGGIAGTNFTDSLKDEIIPAQIVACVNYGDLDGSSATGGITGYNRGFIDGCINKGKIIGKETGGIAGSSGDNGEEIGHIANCINYGDVESERYAGGICAALSYGGSNELIYGIQNCINYGSVTGTECGGICTYANYSYISECANMGDVSGINEDSFNSGNAAGMCVWDSEKTKIEHCFNAGDITATNYAAGLCIRVDGEFNNCYSAGLICSNTKGACGIAHDIYQNGTFLDCAFIGDIQGDNTSNYLIKALYEDDYILKGFDCSSSFGNESVALSRDWYIDFDFENIWTMDPSADYPYPTLRNTPVDFAE